MKVAVALLVLCSLNLVLGQFCALNLYNCNGCMQAVGCKWCSGPYLDHCAQNCTAQETESAVCTGRKDLLANAQFTCASNSSGLYSFLGEFAVAVNVAVTNPTTDISAQAIFYAAIGVPNKPGIFGFQYADVEYKTDTSKPPSISIDAIAAYYALLDVFEFVPNNANNIFDLGSTIIGTPVKFLDPTVGSCTPPQQMNGADYSFISFDYGNGWSVKCRIASKPVTEPVTEIKVSPVNAKCDLTFGNFNYSGRNDTRLGVTIAFVVAGASVDAVSAQGTGVRTCVGDGICLFIGGAKKAGVFTWAKATTRTDGVVVSGISAYKGGEADFVFPDNPATSDLTTVAPGASANVKAFAAANVAVFSFANPTNGDVWDPQMEVQDSSVLEETPSSASFLKYSFALIIVALFARYL